MKMGNAHVAIHPEVESILNKSWSPVNSQMTVSICIKLKHKILSSRGNETDEIKLVMKDTNLEIHQVLNVKSDVEYRFEPNTKMHDFEVVDPFTADEIKISKGAGIGVIIIDSLGLYVKLAYNKSKSDGMDVIFSRWDHSTTAVNLLKGDLYLGYDVLFIAGDKCEKNYNLRHERETKNHEGIIWAPGLDKNLGNYVH
jgi:hypothetical protein